MAARKRCFRLTRGGWALLALCLLMTLGAFNAGVNTIYLLASLLIAVFAVAMVAPLWSLGRLTCARNVPEPPRAGEPFDVTLFIRSKRRTAARLIVLTDELCGRAGERSSGKLLFRLAPGEEARIAAVGRPLPRGAHRAPPLRWSSRFPFGVAECSIEERSAEELLVHPARGRLSSMVASALRPTGMRLGANCRSGLPGEEFRALREYRSGDNPRYIHWRASAHLGSLHVRQMERERSAPVLILLDSRLPDPRDVSARESLEKAISFAAEVCREALKQGNSVKLVAFFPEARLISGATGETGGGPQLRLFLDALARLEPSSEPSAERLVAVADEAGFDSSWKAIAVTPIGETAGSLRAALAGHNVELHVVSEPGFDRLFRLVTEGGL